GRRGRLPPPRPDLQEPLAGCPGHHRFALERTQVLRPASPGGSSMKGEKVTKLLGCAIYTRKSSEEGLDQAFNSLHAQREACEAYIKSQAHEGWRLISTPYDDGGFS